MRLLFLLALICIYYVSAQQFENQYERDREQEEEQEQEERYERQRKWKEYMKRVAEGDQIRRRKQRQRDLEEQSRRQQTQRMYSRIAQLTAVMG